MTSEKERWNKVAKEYSKKIGEKDSQGFLIRERSLNPYLLRKLGNIKDKKVLDYGCGDGWLCEKLKQKGAKIFGCDISEKFIKLAKENYKEIEFKIINNKTSYKNNEFDAIVCNIVLHITKDYEKVLNEMYRILKPGGKAIITIMHPKHYKSEIANFTKNQETLKIKVEGNIPVTYYRRNQDIYEKTFQKAGFKIKKKQECKAKGKKIKEIKKYFEKPFFLLWKLSK